MFSRKEEIFYFLLVIILASFLRLHNIDSWYLPVGDEIDMISRLKSSFVMYPDLTGTYFPTLFPLKKLSFINNLSEYRIFIASLSIVGICVYFFGMRMIVKNAFLVFLSTLLMIVNGRFIFNSRLFLIDWSDFVIPICSVFLFLYWMNRRKDSVIPMIFLLLGIGLMNHAIVIYFIIPFIMWILYCVFKGRLRLKVFLISMVLFLITIFPYILGMYNNIEFVLRWRYTAYEQEYEHPYLVNLVHPRIFFENLSFMFMSDIENMLHPLSLRTSLPLIVVIVSTPLLLYWILCRKNEDDEHLNFLLWQCFGSLAIVLLSVVPAYNPVHFFPFLIMFYPLLIKELDMIGSSRLSVLIIIIILLILFFDFFHIKWIMEKNSWTEFSEIEDDIFTENHSIPIESTSLKTLEQTPFLREGYDYVLFDCIYNGIEPKNILSKHKFKTGDIIIFHSKCDVFDSYSGLDVPLNHLYSIDDLRVFEISD